MSRASLAQLNGSFAQKIELFVHYSIYFSNGRKWGPGGPKKALIGGSKSVGGVLCNCDTWRCPVLWVHETDARCLV